MIKTNNYSLILLFAVISLLNSACSGTKFLAEGEKYLAATELKFEVDSVVRNPGAIIEELQSVIAPSPNGKLLGARPGVWFYHVSGEPKKDKGFKYWLKYKIGKKPVLLSDFNVDGIQQRLKSYLINKGYFRVDITNEINKRKNSASVKYTINAGRPYTIRDLTYPDTDSVYTEIIASIKEESLLKKGSLYDLETLKNEQQRIQNFVENKGLYYFDDNYLIHRADSTVGNHQVDLDLEISANTPDDAKKIYTIGEVKIHPDYSLSINADTSRVGNQSTTYEEYIFVNDNDYIRQKILADAIQLTPGNTYSQTTANYSREHLMSLGVYKFVNIKFDKADSAKLNTNIYLTPLTKKSLRFEVQAVSKSNNFIGPALSVSFLNRNAFRGAELLKISLNSSYDVQVGGQNRPPLNAFELSLQASLTIPRLITPFNIDYQSRRFIPNTSIVLGTRVQERLNVFRLTSIEAKYGFTWQESLTKRHELYPLNVSFVQLDKVSEDFDARLNNDINLSRSLEDQFIIGGLYEYSFSSRNATDAAKRRNHFYFNGKVDVSGNIINAIDRTLGLGSSEESSTSSATYSQYTKLVTDFRYFRKTWKNQELATRLLIGAARAYGNSTEVPFIKQFSAGGSNSIRAFRARSLGPGSYQQEETSDSDLVIDETGDIKLEASVEYRSKLAGVLEGALFVDAGNVWLWGVDEENTKEGGEFSSDFLSETALGAGLGFRFNFSFFILRFDLAFPLRIPSLPKGDRWVISEVNPLDSNWRQDNLLLNIAIGYPF